MFTEPEENNWIRIIAQVLLNSVVNAVNNKSIRAAIKKFSAPAIIISCNFSRLWDKEKILSPHEESNPRASDSDLGRSSTELKTLFGELGYSLPLSFSLCIK